MGRRGIGVEQRWLFRTHALEQHIMRAHRQVERIMLGEFIGLAAGADPTGTADIEQPDLRRARKSSALTSCARSAPKARGPRVGMMPITIIGHNACRPP